MTLDQLKSLKVGQIVKYTNDVDKLNVEYYTVSDINVDGLCLTNSLGCALATIHFNDPDINHIASMLTVDQPLAHKALEPKKQLERELRLIEAKIRDSEFDMECMYRLQHTDTMSGKVPMETIRGQNEIIAKMISELQSLRNQRNALICPNSDHTN